MASPKPNNVSVSLKDAGGYSGVVTARAEFGAGDLVSGIEGALQAWLNLLSAVTGCQITACRYELEIPLTAPASTKLATPGVLLASGYNFKYPNIINNLPYTLHVPGLEPATLAGGKPDNAEGASIDLFMDYMENGAAGVTPMAGTTGGFWINNASDHLGPTGAAYISTRKHRKQLQGPSTATGF
jgi:hypothetical protein